MASVAKDYYRVLGLTSEADGATIGRAYRAIMDQIDAEIEVNGDTDTLQLLRQEIEEAYQVLSDLRRREDYDELRRDRLWWCDSDDADGMAEDDEDWTIDLDSALRRFLNVAASGRAQEVVEILLPFEVAALRREMDALGFFQWTRPELAGKA